MKKSNLPAVIILAVSLLAGAVLGAGHNGAAQPSKHLNWARMLSVVTQSSIMTARSLIEHAGR